jgi:peptidoglycan-N-acetylglucosamine deacetylase
MRTTLVSLVALAGFGISVSAVGATSASAQTACAGNPNALGVSRTVEIDTTGGPGFGLEQYKSHDFLQPGEIVLTFDDGPQKFHTDNVLAALANHCTKATFFSIGKMAMGMPEIIREVAKQGHSVGTHTWSHADLSGVTHRGERRPVLTDAEAIEEIEKGISGVRKAVGQPITPFFRYPMLRDSKATLEHLAKRNVAVFSQDVDSFDFKLRTSDALVKSVIDRLAKKGKGIVLMHDIQPNTGKAVPALLDALKTAGYKVVHLKAKAPLNSLPQYDALMASSTKGMVEAGDGVERATSSVVKTIDSGSATPTAGAAAGPATAAAPKKK